METEMPPQTIESRVEKLEEQVTNFQDLPGRMDALSVQISQVREDLGAQILQLREEVDARFDAVDARFDAVDARFDAVDARFDEVGARISATERTLREEIVAGDERILTQVRVLHEDVVSRLALIQEGQPRPRRRRS
jgi:chromosome segregation ATPase